MATVHAAFESEHVHAVYDEIASDFSRTRHARWPFVERFLAELPAGHLVLDAGTGNGKYLGCRSVLEWDGKHGERTPHSGRRKGKGKAATPAAEDEPVLPTSPLLPADMLPIGFDMSTGLLRIAQSRGHEVVRGDCVDLSCWRRGAFDHAISIATIHHFATPERRVEAIKQMILAVLAPVPPSRRTAPTATATASGPPPPAPPPSTAPRARILIVVWSLEQDPALASDDRSARRKTGGKKGAVPVPVPGVGLASGRGPQWGRSSTSSSSSSEQASLSADIQSLDLNGPAAEAEAEAPPPDLPSDAAQDVFVPWARQNQIPRSQRLPSGGAGAARTIAPAPEPPSATQPAPAAARPVDGAEPATNPSPSPQPPPTAPAAGPALQEPTPSPAPTFNRYYHLFRQYELSSLVRAAASRLGLAFSAPTGYPLEAPTLREEEGAADKVAEREGWEARVWLGEERWERENWVVEFEVGWERRAA